jgi:thiol:disulfide interchange protein
MWNHSEPAGHRHPRGALFVASLEQVRRTNPRISMHAIRKALAAAAAVLMLSGAAALAQARIIYSDTADTHAEIAEALRAAQADHKNIILDFGGNWCGDCQVLDIYFHKDPNLPILEQNYELVHVNVGHYDKNQDVADKYGVPLKKGVPALVVLDSGGHVLYVQKNGEFEAMRRMDPASVTEFLNQWKPRR